jgi:hypothetical protein
MHRKLNVKGEDEVVDAFSLWLSKNQQNIGSQSKSRLEEKELHEIMRQINWPYVSFEKLIDLFKSFHCLRSNIHIKSIFYNEFKSRATKSKLNFCISIAIE